MTIAIIPVIGLVLALAAICGGPSFPRHDVELPTRPDSQLFVGQLVLEDGCLRAADAPANAYYRQSVMLIWPHTFTLDAEGGTVRIVDATGRIAARIGDHVQFSGSGVIDSESARGREWMLHRFSTNCSGPYWLVGEEATAISLDGPTTLTLQLPDSEVHLRRQEPFLGTPSDFLTAEAVGELVVEDNRLGVKTDYDGEVYVIKWPPGFTLHEHRGTVHVRNGAGRIIAQVGDTLSMGGGYSSRGDERRLGTTFGADSITVLSESESP